MDMTTTPLPPPGQSSVEDHLQMSRRFLDHARIDLDNGNRLQASEKAWGAAAAHALKAVGIQRGWHHRSHIIVIDIGEHLGKEFDRVKEFQRHLNITSAMNQNFYENNRNEDAILLAINDAEEFVEKLNGVRTLPPRPFTVENPADQRRLGRFLGLSQDNLPAIGARSEVGFSRTHQNGAN